MTEEKKTTQAAEKAVEKKTPAKKKPAAKKAPAKKPAVKKTAAVPKQITEAARTSKGKLGKLRVTQRYEGQYWQGVGKRKTATAIVRMHKGSGEIFVNNVKAQDYFPTSIEIQKITSPLRLAGVNNEYDISIKVEGGGFTAQAEAIRHGVSRALLEEDQAYRGSLKSAGYLTRDARKKERKKPGLKRARRSPQWSKR